MYLPFLAGLEIPPSWGMEQSQYPMTEHFKSTKRQGETFQVQNNSVQPGIPTLRQGKKGKNISPSGHGRPPFFWNVLESTRKQEVWVLLQKCFHWCHNCDLKPSTNRKSYLPYLYLMRLLTFKLFKTNFLNPLVCIYQLQNDLIQGHAISEMARLSFDKPLHLSLLQIFQEAVD